MESIGGASGEEGGGWVAGEREEGGVGEGSIGLQLSMQKSLTSLFDNQRGSPRSLSHTHTCCSVWQCAVVCCSDLVCYSVLCGSVLQ